MTQGAEMYWPGGKTRRRSDLRLAHAFLALHRIVSPRDFPRAAFQVIESFIPGVFISFDHIYAAKRYYNVVVNRKIPSLEKTTCEVGAALFSESPIVARLLAGKLRRPCRLTDFISQREFRQTRLYQVGFKPFDLRFQIAIPVKTGDEIVAFGINRDRNFSAREWEAVPLLSSHLRLAWDNLVQRKREQSQTCILETASRLDLKSRYGFTPRELDVFHWLAEGKRDAEIATILGTSVRTANHHVGRILHKLNAETRTAAIRSVWREETRLD